MSETESSRDSSSSEGDGIKGNEVKRSSKRVRTMKEGSEAKTQTK